MRFLQLLVVCSVALTGCARTTTAPHAAGNGDAGVLGGIAGATGGRAATPGMRASAGFGAGAAVGPSVAGSGSDGGGSAACVAAGGSCVPGDYLNCARSGPQNCDSQMNPERAFCCLQPIDPACDSAVGRVIEASSYDQTCTSDSDCIAIGEGNACVPCTIGCANAAINAAAEAQYRADIATTLAGMKSQGVSCRCPLLYAPCCSAGHCVADARCSQGRP